MTVDNRRIAFSIPSAFAANCLRISLITSFDIHNNPRNIDSRKYRDGEKNPEFEEFADVFFAFSIGGKDDAEREGNAERKQSRDN
jgi:hypothetical protein